MLIIALPMFMPRWLAYRVLVTACQGSASSPIGSEPHARSSCTNRAGYEPAFSTVFMNRLLASRKAPSRISDAAAMCAASSCPLMPRVAGMMCLRQRPTAEAFRLLAVA